MRSTKRFSLAITATVTLTFALLFVSAGSSQSRVQVTIISTTDMHGNILPIDYFTNRPDARGLAKAATIIRQIRKENPNSLLLDSGDTIQGSPLAYYHFKKNNAPPDPMMLAMSALGYDAMTVGNHEYNFGLKVLEKARKEAKFPWLSSNTYVKGADKTHYDPYLVKEMNGVRVGVLGLTTPGVPIWDNPENYAGLEFHDPVDEAKKWVSVLREKEKADVVVITMHMGLERDLRTGELNPTQIPNENTAIRIAEQVAGVDVILMGHTHRDVPSVYINGVLLAQANHWARHVARVDLFLDRDASGRWKMAAKASRTLPITERVETDAEIARLVEPYDQETQKWLSTVIGESSAELSAREGFLKDTAILDLVQRVQLDAGRADVSMVANFNAQALIPKGQVTVREIASLYVYENTLAVLEVTGQQLKEALETAARYFKPFVAGKLPAELIDPRIPGYNFDMAEGVTYDLDITKPIGQRILNLKFKGSALRPDQKLRLATNNYRVNGGGGYTMYRGAPIVYRSSEEIRELIIDWVEKHKTIPPEPTNNWRLIANQDSPTK